MDKGEVDVESNASCSFVRNDHHNDDYSDYDGEKARKMQRMWSTYLDQNGSVVVTEDEISCRYAEVCYRK